jgi:hypothetical protein
LIPSLFLDVMQRRWYLRCVTAQKNEDLIYTAAEA